MPLHIPAKPQIDFLLRTTKPFHHPEAAKDFLRLVLSYGPAYRPCQYGRSEPAREIFRETHLDSVLDAWLSGYGRTPEALENLPCSGQLMMRGRGPGKIRYFIAWRNWTERVLFNVIQLSLSRSFLRRSEEEMSRYVRFCDDLVRLFPPAHAELYDYVSAIPCTATENMLLPDDLSIRCPALKWRTYFGRPYVDLLGRETLLKAPCWKTEEVGDTVVVQLTGTVFEEIPPKLRAEVVEYLEESVDPEIRAQLGRGFLFRPFLASEPYDKRKKLVPVFPVREISGENHADS